MPAQSTTSFSQSGEGLFTPAEIQRLMRVEFERAQRYRYTMVCMMISVDRLGALQTLYGLESRDEVLQAVVELLERQTRSSDYLGCMLDDRILAVFPHCSPKGGEALARRVLEGARKITFDGDGRTVRISLSIGLSHTEQHGAISFETLMRVAEEGLSVADSAGGDRFVETELYQLFENQQGPGQPAPLEEPPIHRVLGTPQEPPAPPPAPLPAAAAPPPPPPAPAPSEHQVLDEDLLEGAMAELRAEHDRVIQERIDQHNREVETLQRRLSKLTETLGLTEAELQRVLKMKSVDEGVASIYRSVQGVHAEDEQVELKKELMGKIFEANMELKAKVAERDALTEG